MCSQQLRPATCRAALTAWCLGLSILAGPAHPDGLHLESKRIEHGLEARVSLPAKYCAFPGTQQQYHPQPYRNM